MSSKDEENKTKLSVAVSNKVVNAVRLLQNTKGVSLTELKKFLKNSNVHSTSEADAQVQLAIQRNLDKGVLIRDGRNYKVRENKRRRSRGKSRSKGRKRSKSRSKGRKRTRSRKSRGSKPKKGGVRKSRKKRSRRRRTAPTGEQV